MKLVEFVPPTPHPLWKLCPQMGITDVIVKVNPDLTGLPDPWKFETLASIVGRLKSAGLKVVGLEGDPFDMSPIKEFGERGMGNGEREEALAHYCELLESMGQLGIKLLCYNFMVGKGWSRTGVREGRGGAKATYFSITSSSCSTRLKHLVNPVSPVKQNLILTQGIGLIDAQDHGSGYIFKLLHDMLIAGSDPDIGLYEPQYHIRII